jgi:hypothetical protein
MSLQIFIFPTQRAVGSLACGLTDLQTDCKQVDVDANSSCGGQVVAQSRFLTLRHSEGIWLEQSKTKTKSRRLVGMHESALKLMVSLQLLISLYHSSRCYLGQLVLLFHIY